jgi:membrane peptidoglycan carboxypeptidase
LLAGFKRSKPRPAARPKAARVKAPRSFWGKIVMLVTRLFRFVLRLIWGLTWRAGAVAALILAGAVAISYQSIPGMAALKDGRHRGSVTLFDRNNAVYAWRGDQFGGPVTFGNVSPHLVNAVIATEDKRFYRHFGISPRGVASAVRINLSEGRGPLSGNGGSTITQQVAKLVCLGEPYLPSSGLTEAQYEAECRVGSIWRKLKEVPFAMAMEVKFSKEEILAIYLNRAYLGAGARGFEAASQRYFGKSAMVVNPSEAAMLAGLLVAPSYYAPTRNLERAQRRAATVLRLMHEQGHLTSAEYAQAQANPATLSTAARDQSGNAFADWVMGAGPSFLTRETTEDVVLRTTFDQRIQDAAEEALQLVFDTKIREGSNAQAAIVVMNADGAVRAMVGGRDTLQAGQFNRATQAMRQTGSAFKPFVYAAALDLGYRFDSVITDGPLAINIPGSATYSPTNYTNRFYGDIDLTFALSRSLNAATVALSEAVGRDVVRNVAQQFGIESDLAQGPALALGVSESTLVEMTGAYAGILNGGTSVTPYGLTSLALKNDPTPLIGQEGGLGERVIQESSARQLVYMMHEVVQSGTGTRAQLPDGRPAAGKTGTTQAARDAWFIGFTGDYVTGVWMGYDDNTPLSGVTGGGLPAEIWRETMVRVHEGLPLRPLPMIDATLERRPPPAPPQAQNQNQRPQGQQPQRGQDQLEGLLRSALGALFGN